MLFEGKKVLVTGGSRGIGRAMCLAFAREGATVSFIYRNSKEKAEALLAEMGGGYAIQADLRSPEVAEKVTHEAAEKMGGLDILINNAGLLEKCNLEEMPKEHYYDTIDTNVTAAFFCSKAALKYMTAGSAILNMTSQAAYNGSIGATAYSAAKAALLGFTFALSKEIAPRGIRVNTIAPGRVDTDLLAYASPEKRASWIKSTPLGAIGEPEDIAEAALFLCSEKAKYITGANLNVNGGLLMG